MTTHRLSQQGGIGLLNPLAVQQRQQQQQGRMNGIIGNDNMNFANVQAGAMTNNMNIMNNMNANMNGGMNNANFVGGNVNLNSQQSIQANVNQNAMNQNSNLNNLNANDLVRLQQQQQLQQQLQLQQQMHMQQQMQQQIQMQQQLQKQQMQVGAGMNNPNAQNTNLALMAAQQNLNQNQSNNVVPNNNILQSFVGRHPLLAGGVGLTMQGQANAHQNPFFGQLMMNQQQAGMGAIGGAGLVGSNPGDAIVPGMVATANNFQLPSPNSLFSRDASRRMRGGVIEPFPEKLHRLLLEVEAAGRADVISFVANGRAFAIHKADHFFKEIVPLYFRQSRLSSFKRQLNLYGFELINTGPARGGYYHEMFVKERPELCRRMRRIAIKVTPSKDGSGKKKSRNKHSEAENDASKPSDADASLTMKEEAKEDNNGIEAPDTDKGVEKDIEEQVIKGAANDSMEKKSEEMTKIDYEKVCAPMKQENEGGGEKFDNGSTKTDAGEVHVSKR